MDHGPVDRRCRWR